jgi:hypothetical protein
MERGRMPMIIRQGSEWGVGSADSRAETEVTLVCVCGDGRLAGLVPCPLKKLYPPWNPYDAEAPGRSGRI